MEKITMTLFQKGEKFRYIFENQSIEYIDFQNIFDLFSILHEEGHRACNHTFLGAGVTSLADVEQEVEAWKYARGCIKSAYFQEFDSFALICLKTYNSQAEVNYGEWLEEQELLKKIRGVK